MQTVQLKFRNRAALGKSASRKIKKEKFIPAIIYGGEKNLSISVPDLEFRKYWLKNRHGNVFYELVNEEENKKIPTLIKEIQLHPVNQSIQHIDFYELRDDRKLRTKVQVKPKGSSVGVKEGGILEHFLWDVSVECLPKDIPDFIEVDVSEMKIGDAVDVKDLKLPPTVKLLDNPDEIVLSIGLPPKEEVVAAVAPVEGAAVPGAEGAVPGVPGAEGAVPAAGAPGAAAAPGAKPGAPATAAGAKPGAPAAGGKPGAAGAGAPKKEDKKAGK